MDIEYLLFLQSFREATGYALDGVMNAITFMGSLYPLLGLCIVVYWCIDKKTGIYAMMSTMLAGFVGLTLKCAFCVYRPWVRDVRIRPVEAAIPAAKGYSFPSGHTLSSVSLYGALAVKCQEKKIRYVPGLLTVLIVLIAFSRNYCEVHTPQDVLVGAVIGLAALLLAGKISAFLEKATLRRQIIFAVVMTVLALLSLVYIALKEYPIDLAADGSILVDPQLMIVDNYSTAGGIIGIVWGLVFERKFADFSTDSLTLSGRFIRLLAGLIGAAVLMLPVGELVKAAAGVSAGHVIKYALVAFYCIGVYPAIMVWMEKGKKASSGHVN
jgi:membrane-associated phospholipid phosphatase